VNLPLSDILAGMRDPEPSTEVVAYCRDPRCVLSFDAVAALRERGFKARRLADGLAVPATTAPPPRCRYGGLLLIVLPGAGAVQSPSGRGPRRPVEDDCGADEAPAPSMMSHWSGRLLSTNEHPGGGDAAPIGAPGADGRTLALDSG
jgi:hypothetical protein